MRKNVILNTALLGLASLSLVASCGKQKDKVQESLKRTEEKKDLQGSFRSDGKNQFSVVTQGIGCIAPEIEISGNKFIITQSAFTDVNCQGEALGNIVTESTLKVGPELSVAPGARALDLKIDKVTITTLKDKWTEVLKVDTSGECKIASLAAGATKDVTGLNCGVLGRFPAAGQVYFTAYHFANDNTLEFTKLPQESWANIGNEAHPAPRNESLITNFIRK